jgi:hypothetical protein
MTIEPIPSRLDFVAAGRSAFDFLAKPPYSMWLTEQDEGRIGYEGDDVVVVVLHEPISYELDIALWRPSAEDEVKHPFTISDMIRVVDPDGVRTYRRFAARNEDSVRRGVAQLASELRRYGSAALAGETSFFRTMSAARSEATREWGMDLADRAARKNAERAWLQRDFQGVIQAYRSMGDRLSKVERERLNYAIRRLEE